MEDTAKRKATGLVAPDLKLVAWEITRRCNLFCAHCRAAAMDEEYTGELSTQECFRLVDQISEVAKPILILTGGEPLMREDIYDIGRYANSKGFRVVVGTNGTLINVKTAQCIKEIPVSRISISIDFPTADLQDEFRGKKGSFDEALERIQNAHNAGIEVQINSTITRLNSKYLPQLVDMALELKVAAFHPFLLVPTGRGKGLAEQELAPAEYEDVLRWICKKQKELGNRLFFKPTDAPHYQRIMRECGICSTSAHSHPRGFPSSQRGFNSNTRGCMAGTGFCFISHVGQVQGCGYFDVSAGNIREQNFAKVWNDSPLFNELRNIENLKGKCGICEFKRLCGGCRARAYEATGDYLEAEPYCIYQPGSLKKPVG
ncbi:MAG: radical SAM protein [Dehalococcoidales bacterium]